MGRYRYAPHLLQALGHKVLEHQAPPLLVSQPGRGVLHNLPAGGPQRGSAGRAGLGLHKEAAACEVMHGCSAERPRAEGGIAPLPVKAAQTREVAAVSWGDSFIVKGALPIHQLKCALTWKMTRLGLTFQRGGQRSAISMAVTPSAQTSTYMGGGLVGCWEGALLRGCNFLGWDGGTVLAVCTRVRHPSPSRWGWGCQENPSAARCQAQAQCKPCPPCGSNTQGRRGWMMHTSWHTQKAETKGKHSHLAVVVGGLDHLRRHPVGCANERVALTHGVSQLRHGKDKGGPQPSRSVWGGVIVGCREVALKVARWHPAADEGKELLCGCACFLLALFVRPDKGPSPGKNVRCGANLTCMPVLTNALRPS